MADRSGADDAHDLNRFVEAQEGVYDQALAEVRAGRKRSHWMWFIFPQITRTRAANVDVAERGGASGKMR